MNTVGGIRAAPDGCGASLTITTGGNVGPVGQMLGKIDIVAYADIPGGRRFLSYPPTAICEPWGHRAAEPVLSVLRIRAIRQPPHV
jgi:hypothetical protein